MGEAKRRFATGRKEDVIAEADWLLDLGPEGGDTGGKVVAEGPPEKVANTRRKSATARVLNGFWRNAGPSSRAMSDGLDLTGWIAGCGFQWRALQRLW